jgi:hypothetical protein
LKYPIGLKDPSAAGVTNAITNPSDSNFNYVSVPLTLSSVGLGYWGLSHTPYAKLNLDATVRKYLLKFPPIIDLFKFYGGAGVTVNFATPMLSSHLVQDAISESSKGSLGFTTIGANLFGNNGVQKQIINKIISGLTEPSYAAHIDAGVSFKIPIMPIGLYIDGKFMIPFGSLDKYVDVGGTGILLNAGIMLSI